MFWNVLGIEPTTDKKKITIAYREKLVETNPEDKPEQFKALRDAYEQALAYAENGGVSELTPVEKWKQKFEELYNDFTKRKDLECWKQLLSEDICYGLDTKMQIEEVLLNFFMDRYFISHEVWQYLDSRFALMERIEELYETYPKDFVDYVIVNGINYDDTLPLDMFYPGVNGEACETYFSTYLKARNSDLEEAKELFIKLNELPEKHPYGDAMMLIADINEEKASVDQLAEIVEKYNYDHRLALSLANCYFNDNEFVKCEEVCRKGLDNYPSDTRIMWCLANALAGQEKYKDGIEIIHDLMKAAGGDQRQLADLNERRAEWNNSLITKYYKEYEEKPDDNSIKLDLSWALLQNDRYDEADAVSSNIRLEDCEPFDYYNLLSNIDFCRERIDAGLEKLDCLIEVIKNMEDDGTKKTKKRLGRYAEMIARKAYFLCAAGRTEEGLDTYKQAVEVDGSDADVLTQVAQMSYRFKNYEDTIEYSKRLVTAKPNAYHGYLLMAYGQFMLHRDNEAFESVNRSIELYNGDLEAYVLKLRILIRNYAWDGAVDLLQFLEDNNCGDDLSVKYCKAYICRYRDEKDEEALEIVKDIVNQIENEGASCSITDSIYYLYLCILGSLKDVNNPADKAEMLEVADKGLKFNEDHYSLKDYKAWIFMRNEQFDEALAIYKELEALPNHGSAVEFQLGKIYYEDLEKNADLSFEYFKKALDRGNTDGLFYLSYLTYYMNRIDESEKYALMLREDEEKRGNLDIDSYYRMSYVYEKRQQFALALEENDKAMEAARQSGKKLDSYYRHKIRLLRMSNNPAEAIRTVDEMVKVCKNKDGLEMFAEIYMQFGQFDEAKKVIFQRLKDKNEDVASATEQLVDLYYLTGHMTKCKLNLFNYKAVMDKWDAEKWQMSINDYELKFEKSIEIELTRLQEAREKGRNTYVALKDIAELYNRLKDRENAEKYANLALEAFNKETTKYSTSKSLQRISLATIYIILQRYDEAKQLMEESRKDLCASCKYCGCKDADILEVEILIGQGKFEEAAVCCQKMIEKWPEEADFITALEYIKSKRK